MIDCSVEPAKLDLRARIDLFLNNKLDEGQALELIADLDQKYKTPDGTPHYGTEMEEKCSGCNDPLIYTFASGPACQYSRKEKWGKTGCGIVSKYNALAPKGSKMPGTKAEN
jgi:hypothetical protein